MPRDASATRRQCLKLLCLSALHPASKLFSADKPGKQPSGSRPSAKESEKITSLPVVPSGLNGDYAIAVSPSRKVRTEFVYSVKAPRLKASEWLIFTAHPTDLPSQVIKRVASSPASTRATDLSPLKQPLLRARTPVKGDKFLNGITLTVAIEADLFARRLVERTSGDRPETLPTLAGSERQLALRPTNNFDYANAVVQAWRDRNKLVRAAKEGEVDFARRVFQTIATEFAYDYTGDGQIRTASHVCAAAKSDCGGLAILFAAILRSQGIPARILCGRWAMSANPGERIGNVVYFQEHVKAEFFAQGVGWVPADLSSAILHDRTPSKLQYFGQDPGDFLTLHVDSGIQFDTLHFGRQEIEFLQKASYWATGSGDFDGSVVTESWQVTDRQ